MIFPRFPTGFKHSERLSMHCTTFNLYIEPVVCTLYIALFISNLEFELTLKV